MMLLLLFFKSIAVHEHLLVNSYVLCEILCQQHIVVSCNIYLQAGAIYNLGPLSQVISSRLVIPSRLVLF